MKTKEYRITQFIAHFVCILGVILVLFPFVLMIVASFTDNTWATANGFSLFPKAWSIDAYKYIWLEKSTIGRAYVMTIIVTGSRNRHKYYYHNIICLCLMPGPHTGHEGFRFYADFYHAF